MKNCDKAAGATDRVELEFPDWSGMDDSASRINPGTAFELCEKYAEWFPDAAIKWHEQRAEKCLVEFTL